MLYYIGLCLFNATPRLFAFTSWQRRLFTRDRGKNAVERGVIEFINGDKQACKGAGMYEAL